MYGQVIIIIERYLRIRTNLNTQNKKFSLHQPICEQHSLREEQSSKRLTHQNQDQPNSMSNKRQTVQGAASSQATGGTSQQQLSSGNAPVTNSGAPNFLQQNSMAQVHSPGTSQIEAAFQHLMQPNYLQQMSGGSNLPTNSAAGGHGYGSGHHPGYGSHGGASGASGAGAAGQGFKLDTCSAQLSIPKAILWQVKFIIAGLQTKKAIPTVTNELAQLQEKFGTDFDKYLLRELIEQIDLRDPNKPSKDKTEPIKCQLLMQELSRASQNPEFLTYFAEIANSVFGPDKHKDFLKELSLRLKLNSKSQLVIALSLYDAAEPNEFALLNLASPNAAQDQQDVSSLIEESKVSTSINGANPGQVQPIEGSPAAQLLKQKLIDYHQSGSQKAEALEDFATHRLYYIFRTRPEFEEPPFEISPSSAQQQVELAKQFVLDHNLGSTGLTNSTDKSNGEKTAKQAQQSAALRTAQLNLDLTAINPLIPEDPPNSMIRLGSGLDHLTQVNKTLEPWEVLLDLGHFSSYNYQLLSMALQDFRNITEKTMAMTLLQLACNHAGGHDDMQHRIVSAVFEANKVGDASSLKKEPSDKNTQVSWNVQHFCRAFRENFSHLNWLGVFEAFTDLTTEKTHNLELTQKAQSLLFQIFNKSKPQNLQVPISVLLEQRWRSPQLQLQFVINAINSYISGEDKTFNFQKCGRRLGIFNDVPLINESGTPMELQSNLIDVWSSPEVLEVLIAISETSTCFAKIRKMFDQPISQCPEYLLMTLAVVQVDRGSILVDELFSILMRIYLQPHHNSISVLRKMWDLNQKLVIRAVCELCSHGQKIMNLSRVLDITQEIKDSLIKIVYCNDFNFAVSLGILAGKRDFLHYDVWLKERIKLVGTAFVKALIKYINEHVMVPVRDLYAKNGFSLQKLANMTQTQLLAPDMEKLEPQKEQILERSHLSKERFCMTMEHLENPSNFNNPQNNPDAPEISEQCRIMVRDLIQQYAVFFPKQVAAAQNSEEIDSAANDYFQHIFNAEPSQVDERIAVLIETMKQFKQSNVVKEQEIYACMLHSLFDEYRFLHKYPQQFLEKIAKLFGAIIKNKLLDAILQDISLKFVIEAFRRDGKRLSFGIIVVKEFFDCLPDFPRQFAEIYQNKEKILQRDPVLYERFCDLYKATIAKDDGKQDQSADQQFGSQLNLSAGSLPGQAPSGADALSNGNLSDGADSIFHLSQKDIQESKLAGQGPTSASSQLQQQIQQYPISSNTNPRTDSSNAPVIPSQLLQQPSSQNPSSGLNQQQSQQQNNNQQSVTGQNLQGAEKLTASQIKQQQAREKSQKVAAGNNVQGPNANQQSTLLIQQLPTGPGKQGQKQLLQQQQQLSPVKGQKKSPRQQQSPRQGSSSQARAQQQQLAQQQQRNQQPNQNAAANNEFGQTSASGLNIESAAFQKSDSKNQASQNQGTPQPQQQTPPASSSSSYQKNQPPQSSSITTTPQATSQVQSQPQSTAQLQNQNTSVPQQTPSQLALSQAQAQAASGAITQLSITRGNTFDPSHLLAAGVVASSTASNNSQNQVSTSQTTVQNNAASSSQEPKPIINVHAPNFRPTSGNSSNNQNQSSTENPQQIQATSVPTNVTGTDLNLQFNSIINFESQTTNTVASINQLSPNGVQTNLNQQPSAQTLAKREHLLWQEHIDKRINDAKTQKTKMRLEDLIEDPMLQMPSQDAQEQIKFICNNTGKSNFKQKTEDLRQQIQGPQADVCLNWFLHYILTKRISTQFITLHHIFIDLIRQLGFRQGVQRTVKLGLEVLQRCLLIQEEELNKVVNRPPGGQSSLVKQYLMSLGQFLGSLTLAQNRPIFNKEIDLKQLLIQGFQDRNRRLTVVFVSRVLKESTKSHIFRVGNPWINSLLQVLREIYDYCCASNQLAKHGDEMRIEIESLFKALNDTQIHDIPSAGILKAITTGQFQSAAQQVEIAYFERREPLIPVRAVPAKPPSQVQQPLAVPQTFKHEDEISQTTTGMSSELDISDDLDIELKRFNSMQQLLPSVVVQQQSVDQIQRVFKMTENDLRKYISEAVEQSINEILPPVVTRSVTIAVITTRELVLKDFAYDGSVEKLTLAIESIMQNLAGALALVTCRDPLRLSLNEHLVRQLQQGCFQSGTTNGLVKGDILRARDQSEQAEAQANINDQLLQKAIQENDDILTEVAATASKDNLELGCRVIKSTVFESAIRKIKQDPTILEAIEKRQQAAKSTEPFKDPSYKPVLEDLPERLQPSPNGLTSEMTRVYADFSKLNSKSRMEPFNINQVSSNNNKFGYNEMAPPGVGYFLVPPSGGSGANNSAGQPPHFMVNQKAQQPQRQEPAFYKFELEAIIDMIEKQGHLTSVTRSLMSMKLAELKKLHVNASQSNQTEQRKISEQKSKLWHYCENKLVTVCQSIDSNQPDMLNANVEILQLIVKRFTLEDFPLRLLQEVFLSMEEFYVFNVELNLILIKNQILPIREWDRQIALQIRDSPGATQEKAFDFVIEFLNQAVIKQQFVRQDELQQLVKWVKKFEATQQSQKAYRETSSNLQQMQESPFELQLRQQFVRWVELSYISDTCEQEKDMMAFVQELSALGIEQDQEKLFSFCQVMVKAAIDRTQTSVSNTTSTGASLSSSHQQSPQQRNACLDYRYIDSFVKLVVVLLKTFEFNKQEFMSKIFEFVKAKLDADHSQLGNGFNQKPYYRMLINILTVFNASDCFNQKTQRQIQLNMANLLKDLSPNRYPGFAFAWLEIISHRHFMPHFIKKQQAPTDAQGKKLPIAEVQLNQAWFQIKDLLVNCFKFLKHNLIIGQKPTAAMQAFYTATIRIVLVILKDYPEFLCEFHFSFVTALPDHAIQLKNMVLAAVPKNISPPDPFSKDLKVDTMNDVKDPRILSNFEAYLQVDGLKDDLDSYFKQKRPQLIQTICDKMANSTETINGRTIPSSAVINAVVLYIAQQTLKERSKPVSASQSSSSDKQLQSPADVTQKENYELFKQIVNRLPEETRLAFLNSIVNELRYPNSHTFHFCLILIYLFMECMPAIQEQICTILFERLQAHRPFPWGLMINFRELIQNTKYGFMKSAFIQQNEAAISYLFENRLRQFTHFKKNQ